jgi:uncharacterized Zn-binding protein involved in type VI secretion
MSSKAVTRVTDKTVGHGPYKPRATKSQGAGGGSPDVYANNLAVNRVGDLWEPHGTPPNLPGFQGRHATDTDGTPDKTNDIADVEVYANGKKVARVGDTVDELNDTIAGGSPDVFVGTNTGVDLPTISALALTEGDDIDVTDPGSGSTYIAAQITAGKVSPTEIANTGTVAVSASDTTPPKSPGPLSKDCADIASITPFPTGDAIDAIVLTTNYTVGKMTRSPNTTFDNPLRSASSGLSVEEIVCNLKLLAVNCVEPIRAKYPNLVLTNSWRPPSSNPKSQHPKGQACDLQFRGVGKSEYYVIAQWIKDNISYDQLLLEYKTTGTGLPWIHISFDKNNIRKQILTLLNNNTYGQGLIQLG